MVVLQPIVLKFFQICAKIIEIKATRIFLFSNFHYGTYGTSQQTSTFQKETKTRHFIETALLTNFLE